MSATNLPNAILATTIEPFPVSVVRVRIDNLIRYVQVHIDLLAPERNVINGEDPQILKMSFPAGVKCFLMTTDSLELQPTSLQLGGLQNHAPGLPVPSHPVTHDYESFTVLRNIRERRDMLCVVSHPAHAHRGKMWRRVTEMPGRWLNGDGLRCSVEHKGARDATMHRYVSELGLGVAPDFYGHVTEEGRGLVGFFYEYDEGAQNLKERQEAGHACSREDLRACNEVIKKLHDNGLCHGNLQPHNVFRRPDGSMVLIDFANSYRVGEEPQEGTVEHLQRMDLTALLGWAKA
ncbi:alpha-galactosidase A precursor [Apiospora sp. TS-2023a]